MIDIQFQQSATQDKTSTFDNSCPPYGNVIIILVTTICLVVVIQLKAVVRSQARDGTLLQLCEISMIAHMFV